MLNDWEELNEITWLEWQVIVMKNLLKSGWLRLLLSLLTLLLSRLLLLTCDWGCTNLTQELVSIVIKNILLLGVASYLNTKLHAEISEKSNLVVGMLQAFKILLRYWQIE